VAASYRQLIPRHFSESSLQRRVRPLNRVPYGSGPVLYWMSRDQRLRDNWGLLYAQKRALAARAPLAVLFCLAPRFLEAAWRQYDFLIRGLEETARGLEMLNIPFLLLEGEPPEEVPAAAGRLQTRLLVTDFDPLTLKRDWLKRCLPALRGVSVYEADSRNIVPCWQASGKQEYAAHTLRPKLLALLPEYIEEPPPAVRHPHPWPRPLPHPRWERARRSLKVDRSVAPVNRPAPGEEAARRRLAAFCAGGLTRYAAERNDPNAGVQSGLSAYLHFGQLSSLRAAIAVLASDAAGENKDAFLEELITRRELADNFCAYNPAYAGVEGFPPWARKTLSEHAGDGRDNVYSLSQLERARTHDELWNAAQRGLVAGGSMPGYLRMYWAKKILEWSASAAGAMRAALNLNDRYQLDGRDSNGYAGIAWSIGGVHDRPWFERPIFGKIRYMSYGGCARKFDVPRYIREAGGA
jgi:deoxyribodipyrimidine photo-lyase